MFVLNTQLDASYVNDDTKYLESKLIQMQKAAANNRLRETWQLINEVSGKKQNSCISKLKKKDGSAYSTKTDLLKDVENYFNDLLSAPPPPIQDDPPILPSPTDLDIDTRPFTVVEVEIAIKQCKLGKSPGTDSAISPEALQNAGPWAAKQLCDLFNRMVDENRAPRQFTTSLIVPLPKKGDLSQLTNYRGISLMSHSAKIYNRILLNRIRGPIDAILRPNQAGFRRGRACIDQIHVLRVLLAAAYEKQLPLFICFVDFRKAFDSIIREKMFKILRHYGIPEKIVTAIKLLYTNSRSSVLVEGQLTGEFTVNNGVLQGDTLAPLLFIIVIDYVMKNSVLDSTATCSRGQTAGFVTHLRNCEREPAISLYDLDFADDIALLEGSHSACQAQLTTVSKRANQVGLVVNHKKTEVMTNQPQTAKILLDGHEIETVDNFKYLGSMMRSSATDIKVRKGQAWSAFHKMNSIWRSKKVGIRLKVNIFRASCLAILLYGCESWVLTTRLEDCINAFATNAYRIMLNIRRLDKISNKVIYDRVGQGPLINTVHRRQLRFIGHSLRRPSTEPINKYALYTPAERHGKRKRGKPAKSYAKYISSLVTRKGDPPWTVDMIALAAANRKEWNSRVVACTRPPDAADQ